MNIDKYQFSEDFDRNQALYVLHTIDGLSLDDLSKQFDLAVDEVKDILKIHKQYELALSESY